MKMGVDRIRGLIVDSCDQLRSTGRERIGLVVEDAMDNAAVGYLFRIGADRVGIEGERTPIRLTRAAQNIRDALVNRNRRLVLLVVLNDGRAREGMSQIRPHRASSLSGVGLCHSAPDVSSTEGEKARNIRERKNPPIVRAPSGKHPLEKLDAEHCQGLSSCREFFADAIDERWHVGRRYARSCASCFTAGQKAADLTWQSRRCQRTRAEKGIVSAVLSMSMLLSSMSLAMAPWAHRP